MHFIYLKGMMMMRGGMHTEKSPKRRIAGLKRAPIYFKWFVKFQIYYVLECLSGMLARGSAAYLMLCYMAGGGWLCRIRMMLNYYTQNAFNYVFN